MAKKGNKGGTKNGGSAGDSGASSGGGAGAVEVKAVDALVVDEAAPGDTSVKVAIGGAPPSYVPRQDLATFLGGAADDFGADLDAWGAATY